MKQALVSMLILTAILGGCPLRKGREPVPVDKPNVVDPVGEQANTESVPEESVPEEPAQHDVIPDVADVPDGYRPGMSYFAGRETVDLSDYPDQSLYPMGFEDPWEIPTGTEPKLNNDALFKTVFVVNIPMPEKSLEITVEDPLGQTFSCSDPELWTVMTELPPEINYAEPPVLAFPFDPGGLSVPGDWIFTLCPDDRKNGEIRFTDSVFPARVVVSRVPRSEASPFEPDFWSNVKQGDTLHIFGYTPVVPGRPDSGETYHLVVYRMTDEIDLEEGAYYYVPMIACRGLTGKNGVFNDLLVVGEDLPPGSYQVGIGLSAQNVERAILSGRFRVAAP